MRAMDLILSPITGPPSLDRGVGHCCPACLYLFYAATLRVQSSSEERCSTTHVPRVLPQSLPLEVVVPHIRVDTLGCMRAALTSQVPNIAAALLLFFLFTKQVVSFALQPSQSRHFVLTGKQSIIRRSDASLAIRTPSRARGSPGCPAGVFSCTHLSRRCRYSLACSSAAGAAAGADKTVVEIKMTEVEMPELKVLRVDEVPTVKADPVDPVAREQAKVRRACVCTSMGGVCAASIAHTAVCMAV